MANTNNPVPKLPKQKIKRRLEDIIIDEWKLELVDQFTTSVGDAPQVWITDFDDSFTPISNVNDKTVFGEIIATVSVFSETRETEVHNIIFDLINLAPKDFKPCGVKVNSITPISQPTGYQNDASNGHVMAGLTFSIKYFFERTP